MDSRRYQIETSIKNEKSAPRLAHLYRVLSLRGLSIEFTEHIVEFNSERF